MLDLTLAEIVGDIHALTKDLQFYERKYGVLSETFYEAYMSGEEPEDDAWVPDFAMWAGTYQTWLDRQRMYRSMVLRLRDRPASLSRPHRGQFWRSCRAAAPDARRPRK